MHQNCRECTRLWSEYALATRHYLKLEGRLQIAGVSQDRATIAELTPLMERATAERSEWRRLIQEHEACGRAEAASAEGANAEAANA
jgi:hypothetical protein